MLVTLLLLPGHEGEQSVVDVLDRGQVAPGTQLTGCGEGEVETTAGAGPLDDLDGLVQVGRGCIDVTMKDAGKGKIAEDNGGRLAACGDELPSLL
ncbi:MULTISPECIES: hypothetical protein [Micromonospora]|uniref:hypothetical protein n=1 Tax=Micromonospora TaxID=1873 RepID=UPI000F5DDCE2|nr:MULTISPECIES: hypothetical protein [Micromonospora]RQX30533.1 hypothetical protein DLJ57_20910 [Micromonospora chalcea]